MKNLVQYTSATLFGIGVSVPVKIVLLNRAVPDSAWGASVLLLLVSFLLFIAATQTDEPIDPRDAP